MAKKNRGGRPPFQPTDQQRAVVKALVVFGHNQTRIAAHLQISEPTLLEYFREELSSARLDFQAHAVGGLYKGIKDGQAWAVMYYLRTQGKAFGWSERINVGGGEGADPFKGLDLSKLSPPKMRQFLELLVMAGADIYPDEPELLMLNAAPAGRA